MKQPPTCRSTRTSYRPASPSCCPPVNSDVSPLVPYICHIPSAKAKMASSPSASRLTAANAAIIAALITATVTLVTWFAGFARTSASPQPTNFFQTVNSGIQVFGDLVGGNKSTGTGTIASTSSSPMAGLPPSGKVQFPAGTLDRLTSNTSLLDGATWPLSPAPGDRSLYIDLRIQAEPAGEGTGIVTVRLLDSKNAAACTATINSATSPRNGKTFYGGCQVHSYLAPANTATVFRAEVKAENAKPLAVELNDIIAKPRQ